MFLLKKIITPLFYPCSVIMLLLLTGLALLWFTRRQKAGKIVLTAGAGLFLILSYDYVPDLLLAGLENRYPPLSFEKPAHPIPPVKWIVVLGGGYAGDHSIPVTDQVSSPTLKRVAEGIRIHKGMPDSSLVLSGGPVFSSEPEARIMMKVAMLFGINEKNIVLETLSRDTEEQALYIKQLAGRDRFILVTSAHHMPRSMMAFKLHGLAPIAAPADRLTKRGDLQIMPRSFFPSASGLYKASAAVHEYLGLGWLWMKIQIMSAA